MKLTHKVLLAMFGVLLMIALAVVLAGCSTTRTATKYELTGVENETSSKQYIGIIVQYSYPPKNTSDSQCPYTVKVYTKINPGDEYEAPMLIIICGYHTYIHNNEKAWIKRTLPLHYKDQNRYLITNGYIFPVLGTQRQ